MVKWFYVTLNRSLGVEIYLPNYKHQRRVGRVESQIDWDGLFKIMSDIREEFINKLPFKVLHVDKCGIDDIIGTLW